jgi:Ca2+-transporting ATPase
VRTISNLGSLAEAGATGQNTSFHKLPDGTVVDLENPKGEPETMLQLAKKPISFYYQRSWQQTAELLKTNPEEGLSEAEASERLKLHGKNELASEPRDPWWKIFLGQLTDLLVVMLLVAAIVSGAFEEYAQCAFIIILVVGMATLGTYQEVRAGDSLDALSSLSAPNADVVRGGKTVTIDSTLLVPGDIILMEMGRTIPADSRLVSCQGLQSAEAALTGESVGKKKDAEFKGIEGVEFKDDKGEKQENQNICFMGCTVLEGRGRAIVVKTGMNTEMGLIASLMNSAAETKSPLQTKLEKLGKQLGISSLALSMVVWIIGVSTERGLDPTSTQDKFLQMTLVAVALTVAAVPEALPTMVTITLAMGMNRMSQRKALLRNLHGTVTLASVSVICSDKTGTLTAGEMTATRVWVDHKINRITGIGFKPEGFVVPEGTNLDDAGAVKGAHDLNRKGMHLIACAVATLCSDVTIQDGEIKGNMSEKPLVVATLKTGMSQNVLSNLCPRIHEIPFDPKRKMMSTLVKNGGNTEYKANGEGLEEFALSSFPELRKSAAFSCVKGAPNFVLEFCTHILRQDGKTASLSEDEKKTILSKIDDLSSEALRVLAVAVRLFDRAPSNLEPENVERELVLVGMFASIDPERPEVKPAIQTAYNAGIRVVAISGDYTKTLFAIAKNIGLLRPDAPFAKVLDCGEIRPDGERAIAIEATLATHKKKAHLSKDDEKNLLSELATINSRLDKVTAFVDCFGRAKPQDKIVILKSLQRQGHIASMTGDGVNDAPALKQANIGVAMGSGTDAAKAASSMILVDDSFSTIVAGVEEGRAIFRNISIFIFMLLSENVGEVIFVLISICFNQPSPLGAIQLLLLNLFTDGAPAIALAVETSGNDSLMSEGPRNPNESIISPLMRWGILVHSVILCGMCCLMYTLALIRHTGSEIGFGATREQLWAATTVSYLYIVSAELLRAYTCRSLRDSLWKIGVFSNQWMQKSVGAGFVGAVAFAVIPELNEALGFVQLTGIDWAYILGLCWVPCIAEEILKWIYRETGYGLRPIATRGDKRED